MPKNICLFFLAIALILPGCKPPQKHMVELPNALVSKKEGSMGSGVLLGDESRQEFSARDMPYTPLPIVQQGEKVVDPDLQGSLLDLSLTQIPLPSFIKIVFGDNLRLNIDIAPDVSTKSELITLRTAEQKTPKEVYSLAKQVLAAHGVEIKVQDNLYRFVSDKNLEVKMPLILRTRSTVDVPVDLRPVFQIVDIASLDKNDMKKYLDQAFPGQGGGVTPAEDSNALIIYGTQDVVKGMVEAIRMFDRPAFAGRKAVRINLKYLTAENLSGRLMDIMQTEGYFISDDPGKKSAITILPITSLNSLLVFAADSTLVSHVIAWIKELDVPTLTDPNGNFYYIAIRNTEAREIGDVINQVLAKTSLSRLASASRAPSRRSSASKSKSASSRSRNAASRSSASRGGKLVVDEERNGLIFNGTAEEFAQIKPLVDQMDVPARQVLIEVTVAEFRLNNEDQRGFEGFIQDAVHSAHPFGKGKLFYSRATDFFNSSATPPAALAGGFNFTVIDNNNVKRAVAHLLSTSSRTTILSSPKLLTRSGGEAKFMVGSRVPILKSRSNERTGNVQNSGTTPLVQDVAYEKAGIVLEMIPTVRAGRRVDIDISQEISSVVAAVTGGIESPSFDETKVETKLSLSDGATVLLAGFIKDQKVTIRNGIPVLKDIPAIGALFRTDNDTKEKREIILMITPYIIDTDQEAHDITEAFKNQLCWICE